MIDTMYLENYGLPYYRGMVFIIISEKLGIVNGGERKEIAHHGQ